MTKDWKLGIAILMGFFGGFCGCVGYADENIYLCVISVPLLLLAIGLSTKIEEVE